MVYSDNPNHNTVNSNASQIANKPSVAARIAHHKATVVKAVEKKAIASLEDRLEHATQVMTAPDAPRAVQLQANKLLGEYNRDFVTQIESKNINVDAVATLVELLAAVGLATPDVIEKLEAYFNSNKGQSNSP